MDEPRSTSYRIQLFGRVAVSDQDGAQIELVGQTAALLTLLALAPRMRRTREALAERLWPDRPPDETGNNFRNLLSKLRSELRKGLAGGEALVLADKQAVWLDRHLGLVVDALEFDRLFDEARRASTDGERVERLSRAIELYAGPLAPGVTVDEIVAAHHRFAAAIDGARAALLELRATPTPELVPWAAISNADVIGPTYSPPPLEATREGQQLGSEPISSPTSLPHRPRFRWLVLAASLLTLVVTGVSLWARRPEPTPEQRIRLIQQAMLGGSPSETRDALNDRMRRISDQCISLGEDAWAAAYGPQEDEWLRRLRVVDDAMRQCLAWLENNDPDGAQELAGALSRYWWIDGRQRESEKWLEAAIRRSRPEDSDFRARAVAMHAMCVMDRGENCPQPRPREVLYNQALDEIGQAHAVYARRGHRWGEAHTLRCMGHVLHAMGRDAEAEQRFYDALRLFHDLNAACCEAYTYWGLGLVSHRGVDSAVECAHSADLMVTSVELQQRAGNEWCLATAWNNLCNLIDGALAVPDRRSTAQYGAVFARFLTVARTQLDRQIQRGNVEEARRTRRFIGLTALALNDRPLAVEQLGYLIWPGREMEYGRRALLFGAYLHYCDLTRNPPLTRSFVEQWMIPALVRSGLPPARLSTLLDKGRRMTLEAALKEAVP